MKQLLVLIFITLSFICLGQTNTNKDIDFNDIVEKKGLLYFKSDTTLVTGRVIRYNKKKVAKRYIIVRNGKPDNLGWIYFNEKYESPKESGLGTLVSVAAFTTGAVMALTGNDIDARLPINRADKINNSIIQNDVDDILDYNKEIAAKANDDMSQNNEITKNLNSNYNSEIINEPSDGLYQKFNEDVQPAIKENPIDSKRTGERKKYYSNGKLESKGYLIKGNKEGLWEVYHENEQLYSKGYYIKGKKDGFWEEYFKNGQIKSKINFIDGKEDGLIVVFNENGEMSSVGKYLMGKRTGEWKEYYPNGQLHNIGSYFYGTRIGEWKSYTEKGKLITTVNFDD